MVRASGLRSLVRFRLLDLKLWSHSIFLAVSRKLVFMGLWTTDAALSHSGWYASAASPSVQQGRAQHGLHTVGV